MRPHQHLGRLATLQSTEGVRNAFMIYDLARERLNVERLSLEHTNCYFALLGDAVEFTPPGGYFFWLTFTDGANTDALLPIAHKRGVNYRPGTAFSASGAFTNAIRLAFALYEPDMLAEGIRRIAQAHRSL